MVVNQTNPQIWSESAAGKAILVGEHAVVYGARALAMPLAQLRVGVEVEIGQDLETSDLLQAMAQEAFDLMGVARLPLTLRAFFQIPMGAGLGSSASLCTALLKTLMAALQRQVKLDDLARLAQQMETRFHGKPSGLDTSVVVWEKPIFFQKGGTPLEVKPFNIDCQEAAPRGWPFVLIDSGERAKTSAMIEHVAPYFLGATGEERIAKFDRLAEQAKIALEQGQFDMLGQVMNEAHMHLREAGAVTETLHTMRSLLMEKGILAGKVTGAGGGGCLLVLLDPMRISNQLKLIQDVFRKQLILDARLQR